MEHITKLASIYILKIRMEVKLKELDSIALFNC